MPALETARESARRTVCGASVRQFLMACHMYAGDWNDRPPSGSYHYGVNCTAYGRYVFCQLTRCHLARNYNLSAVDCWFCPNGKSTTRSSLYRSFGARYVHLNCTCSGVTTLDNNSSLTCYGYLIGAGWPCGSGSSQPDGVAGASPGDLPTVTRLSRTVRSAERIAWWDAICADGQGSYGWGVWTISVNNHYAGAYCPQGANCGMVDGHVQWRAVRWGDNITSNPTSQYYPWKP